LRARRLHPCTAAPLALLIGVAAAGAARAELWAERMTGESFAARRVGGPDADGGIGDWALGNGVLCAVVSDPGHESPLSSAGGVLIDLGHCGVDDDQWSTLQPLVNLQRGEAVPFDEIRGEVVGDEARLVTRAALPGARLTTTYSLSTRDPEVLRVVTGIERLSEEGWIFAYGDVVLHASGQLRPFALLRSDPARSPGFHHPGGRFTGLTGALQALVAADAHVLVGGDAFPPITYGLVQDGAWHVDREGGRTPLPSFANSSADHSMVGFLADRPWVGGVEPPGWVALAQLPLLDLDPGESLRIERSLHVTRRRDVASVTDRLYRALDPDVPLVTGRTAPGAGIVVASGDGQLTATRADAEGRFAAHVPAGRHELRLRVPWRERIEPVAVGAEGLDLGAIDLGRPARVTLPRGLTARLVFVGEGATPTPVFGDDGLDVRVGGKPAPHSLRTHTVSLIGGEADPAEVELPPGDYRVLATRGLEFTVGESALSLAAGERVALEIDEPVRAVATPGWIAADLHLHSAESYDSGFPLERQLAAFAAFGGEVLVASEHDRVFDPRSALRRLGLGDRVIGLVGVEVTGSYTGGASPYTIGHLNAFPVPYDVTAPRGGAPRAEGRRLREVLRDLRGLPSPPLAQLNHPRDQGGEASDGAYFSHLSVRGEAFDPTRPLSAAANSALVEPGPDGERDVDYDAVELLNGPSLERYRRVRADWLSLQRQGVRHTATGNSDSHRAGVVPAIPRNYVPVGDPLTGDDVAAWDPAAFVDALRAGRSFATTGPFVVAELEGIGPGGTFAGSEGVLSVRIDAPDWVDVEDLRIYVDGELAHRRAVHRGDTFEHRLKFQGRDAFVTVEVEGQTTSVYRAVVPGFVPFAFTNPIRVDADGDGAWTPPGVSGPLPDSISDPLGAP